MPLRALLLSVAIIVAGCAKEWEPVPLVAGYQIMDMNPQEVYVADSERVLLVGPTIIAIGIAPGFIVVDCGPEHRVVNDFQNTVGLNVIETDGGVVRKNLTRSEVETILSEQQVQMPEMKPLSAYLP